MSFEESIFCQHSNHFISQINIFAGARKPTSTCMHTSYLAKQHDCCFPLSIYRERERVFVCHNVMRRYNDGKHAMFMSIIINKQIPSPGLVYTEGGIIDSYYIHSCTIYLLNCSSGKIYVCEMYKRKPRISKHVK